MLFNFTKNCYTISLTKNKAMTAIPTLVEFRMDILNLIITPVLSVFNKLMARYMSERHNTCLAVEDLTLTHPTVDHNPLNKVISEEGRIIRIFFAYLS